MRVLHLHGFTKANKGESVTPFEAIHDLPEAMNDLPEAMNDLPEAIRFRVRSGKTLEKYA